MTYAELMGFTVLGWCIALLMAWALWMAENRSKKLLDLFDEVEASRARLEAECRKLIEEVQKHLSEPEDDGDAWKRQ